MASRSSSSSSTSDRCTTTTVAAAAAPIPIIDVEAEFEIVEHYKQILFKYSIFIPNSYFLPMIRSGSMDQFVQIIEDMNREHKELSKKFNKNINYKRSHENENDNGKNDKNEDGNDEEEEEEEESHDNGPAMKKIKIKNIITTDVSTQTGSGSTPIFIDRDTSDQEEIEPGHTYMIKSFYDTD